MTQYARVETKRVPMHDPLCAAKIAEHFSNMHTQPFTPADAAKVIEERCGRFTRGAHVGQLRGWAEMEIVVVGGWLKREPGQGNGRVVYPGAILSIRIADYLGKLYMGCER